MSGCVSLVLAALKLTEMKSWSWWRVLLPFWVIVGQNVIYVLVGFLCLFAVRYGEDEEAEEPAKVQSDRIVYQIASLVCVLISTDNLLRWLERGVNSYWFWLCSGSVARCSGATLTLRKGPTLYFLLVADDWHSDDRHSLFLA